MKTNRYYFLILFPIILFSCSDNESDILYRKLQGDWIYHNVETNSFISFKDSLFFGWEYYNEFKPYFIYDKVINIPSYQTTFNFSRVTDKYLWILDEETKKENPIFYNTNIFHNNEIKLKNIEIRFHNFWHRGLVDWAIYIEDNQDCYLKIKNTSYNKKIENPISFEEANYFTKLTKSEFEFYENKFRNIPISKVESEYFSKFEYDNGKIDFSSSFSIVSDSKIRHLNFTSHGFEGLPSFLAVFVIHLNKVHDFIKFDKSDKSYEFIAYQNDKNYLNQ